MVYIAYAVSVYVPYITISDYAATIQSGQLNDQILDELENGTRERQRAEAWAIGVVKSKIGNIYNLDLELTPTLPFSSTKIYGAGERCVIDFSEWVAGTQYDQDALVIHEGRGWIRLPEWDGTPAQIWDEQNWQSIGKQYGIYYVPYPNPIFQMEIVDRVGVVTGNYKTGDIVWWNGHTYACIVPTSLTSQSEALNYPNHGSLPSANVYPTSLSGASYWKDLGSYSLPLAGILPIEESDGIFYWTEGDNRDILISQAVIDLALFKLHDRISPNNIPELRINNMRSAISWLGEVKESKETVPSQFSMSNRRGNSISWGSANKKRNGY